MTNTQNQFWMHPDTGAGFSLIMEEEEFAPIVNMTDEDAQKQAIRDLYVRYQAAQAAKQADLDEVRGAKLQALLDSAKADSDAVDALIAAWPTATNAQKLDAILGILQREKRARLRERAMIRALWRLIG